VSLSNAKLTTESFGVHLYKLKKQTSYKFALNCFALKGKNMKLIVSLSDANVNQSVVCVSKKKSRQDKFGSTFIFCFFPKTWKFSRICPSEYFKELAINYASKPTNLYD